MHDLPLITTIAAGFTAAWILGLLTQRLGLSPIIGYLLAGVLIGPHTPGFVGDVQIAQQLAEVGVILLMFGVGLHFHLKDLLAVKGVAIPGAVGQSLVATLIAIPVFSWFGVPMTTGAVIGMALAVASTVVLMRVLMDADALNSPQGHVAVGWLIVEDIFTVVLLVLIPVLGGPAVTGTGTETHATPEHGYGLAATLGLALLKLAALVLIVMFAGSKIVPWILMKVAKLRSRELFTLTVLVFSIAIAAGSYVFFGASMALGAFLAGMVVAQSPLSHQAAAEALPLRDAFAVLFFVSVGMLFDPSFVIQQPLMIAAALGIILVAKPLAALLIVTILGHSARIALTVALGLAQIGEFSFILSALAREHRLMTDAGHNVLVASAIISITLNPLIFRSLPRIERWLQARPGLWKLLNGRAERRASQTNSLASDQIAKAEANRQLAVVAGYGPVGKSVHRLLQEAGLATVVVDLNTDTVSALTTQGQQAIYGDAAHESILEQAGVRRATHFILTLPHSSDRAAVVATARLLNPRIRVLVRARYLREREDLERAGANAAVFEEAEAAVALARLVLADTGVHRENAERKVRDLRLRLILENMSNIRAQNVRGIMIPWSRVRRLPASASREEVLGLIAQQRFSRWPVVEPGSGKAIGYLLAKDMIAQASGPDDWQRLVRPLQTVSPEADVESTLMHMQNHAASMYLVEDAGFPLGLVTLEDVLERVVGRIEDEYPREASVSLADAISESGRLVDLGARTPAQAIAELSGTIPADKLPPGTRVADLALTREAEVSTDLGVGVAIPHARCPGLLTPMVVLGRSNEGIVFSAGSSQPVRLVFLLVTPAERTDVQLALLAQIAQVAGDPSITDRLRRASTIMEVAELVREKQRPPATVRG